MVTRIALLGVAILALAWIGVLWRDQRIVDSESSSLIGHPKQPAAAFEARASRLERAAFLNPDPTWRQILGFALLTRDPRRAAGELNRVVADEPDNVSAWRLLYLAAGRFDQRLSARARDRVKELDPYSVL